MLCVGADWVTPSEFYRLRPRDVWWLIEAKIPPEKRKPDDNARLYEVLKRRQMQERLNP